MSEQSAFSFDPETQDGTSFDLIPPGDYVAQVIEADIRPPKSGDGHMLVLTWKVCEGEYEGRQVWETLCYRHSNPQTQDIARKKLKDICVAFGITEQVSDPESFLFKPARVKIGIQSDKYGQFDDKNFVKRVWPLRDSEPTAQTAKPTLTTTPAAAPKMAPTTKPAAASGHKQPPWEKKAS
jgi:hypothetical protein